MKMFAQWILAAGVIALAPVDACTETNESPKESAKSPDAKDLQIEAHQLERKEDRPHQAMRVFKLTSLGASGVADFESYWKLTVMVSKETKPAADSALGELKAIWARAYSHIWLASEGEKKVAIVRAPRDLPGDVLMVSLLDRDGKGPTEVVVRGWDAKQHSLKDAIATAEKGAEPPKSAPVDGARRRIREIRD
jgi:hypothetical protein